MRRAALLALLLLVPACGDDGDPTSAARVSTTVGPSDAPSAEPSPTPAAASPSPQASPARATTAPAPRPKGPAAQGDVDGDGEPDLVTVDENLAVELSGSGRTVASAFETDTSPVTSGVEDIDRDGRAEVFLRTGQGASTTFLTPFRYDGSRFAPLTLDGQQVKLGIGGSATHGDGFSCTEAGTLVVRSASSDDGTTFTVTETTYRIDGHALVQTGRTTATANGMDDPRVGAAYLVDCRSVGEGG